MSDPLDRIFIRDLTFRCILGIYDEERLEKQDVVVNITLLADLKAACLSDQLRDTVDYKALKAQIIEMAESSQYQLVEALAQHIAAICLSDERVKQVTVSVEKPTALRFARTVGIEITRTKDIQ